MKKLKQFSIIGIIGGSFVVKHVWLDQGKDVWAATGHVREDQETDRMAGLIPGLVNLLVSELDFNTVPEAQTTDEDTPLQFSTGNNNVITVRGPNVVTTTVSVNHGVISILAGTSLITDGANVSNSFTLSGTATQISSALSSLNYSPDLDFNGLDQLIIVTTDSNGERDTDIIQINIRPIDDGSPDAVNDDFSTPLNTLLTGNILANDTVIDEAAIDSVVNATTSQGGTISIDGNGSMTYTPAIGFFGSDSFVYTLRDADNETDTATINIVAGIPEVIIADNNGVTVGDESVVENLTLISGSFTLVAAAGLASGGEIALSITDEDVGDSGGSGPDLALTSAQLNNLPSSNQTVVGLRGNLTLKGFNSSSGIVTYDYDPTNTSQDHLGGDTSLVDSFAIIAIDVDDNTSAAESLDILVVDTNPMAVNDNRSMSEDTSAIAGNAVGAAGSAAGDSQDTLVDLNANPVIDLDFGATDGAAGSRLAGELGDLVINSAGVYTYTLDNTRPDVQGLKAGESDTDVFTYTIQDGDGDIDTATISVTVNGVEDALPTITITDVDGNSTTADNSVREASGDTVNGSITVSATAGIQAVLIDGQSVTNASATNVTITGDQGQLEISSYNPATGIITYGYVEDGDAEVHNAADTNIADSFSIQAVDNEGDSTTETLDILITDTSPTANLDSNSIDEDAAILTVTDNVLTNDTPGADTPLSVTGIDFDTTAQTVGANFSSDFGSMNMASNGAYTYTLNNDNASVQALRTGQSLTETFTFTISDADGDASANTLNITINGVNDAPVLVIPDSNGSIIGSNSVAENSTLSGQSFSITAEAGLAPNGTALLLVDEQGDSLNLTLAQLQNLAILNPSIVAADGMLTLNGYSTSSDTSTINYSFDPTGTSRNHSGGDLSVRAAFSITASDADSNFTSTEILELLITDTVPTAAADTTSVTEDAILNIVTGDVIVNDTQGADTSVSVVGIDYDNATRAVGVPFATEFGTLDLNSDGTYTYTLDNGNSNVQSLNTGQNEEEVFSYTITDTDGDTSTTTLSVTINGSDE